MLTVEHLKELLSYSPETGVFTWLVSRGGRAQPGAKAGTRNVNGYWRIDVEGEKLYAHRLAWLYMTGSWPKGEIDHINGVRADNRFPNLREATVSENRRNVTMRRHNTSGVFGVTFDKARKKWKAQIVVDRKCIFIGRFDAIEDAKKARDMAAADLHGIFRRP